MTVTPWTTASTADGRVGTLELWLRDGFDPVELMSSRERERLEQLLAAL